jgi:hypothetical protein
MVEPKGLGSESTAFRVGGKQLRYWETGTGRGHGTLSKGILGVHGDLESSVWYGMPLSHYIERHYFIDYNIAQVSRFEACIKHELIVGDDQYIALLR